MTDDPQNVGPLMASLGARRLGVDHWTEHDFEMERVGRKQSAETYRERLDVLEAHGWVPSHGPFYYARREYHRGYTHPERDLGRRGRVPTDVAFAMLLEDHPEIKLPAYRPHPQGWKRPPSSQPLFHTELVSVEPMKVPAGGIFALANYEYGTEEEKKARREKKARMDAVFKHLPGVRAYGTGTRYDREAPAREYFHVTLEDEASRAAIPETWEGLQVEITVKPEAEERAEREAKQDAAYAKYREEAAWVAKANRIR
jgi:hypothetical protein